MQLIVLIAAQLSVAGIQLQPNDFLDGRAIAGAAGTPLVLLTLTPTARQKLVRAGKDALVALDGKPVVAHLIDNTIEVQGQPTFDAAVKLAREISGKPPLPDSLDE